MEMQSSEVRMNQYSMVMFWQTSVWMPSPDFPEDMIFTLLISSPLLPAAKMPGLPASFSIVIPEIVVLVLLRTLMARL